MTGLQLEHVTKYYEEGGHKIAALQDVSLSVEQGEFVAGPIRFW